MFIISRVFDHSSTALIKVSGDVTEIDLRDWADLRQILQTWKHREVIFDLSGVSTMTPAAVELLAEPMPVNLRFMNCSTSVTETFIALGPSHLLLDGGTTDTGFRIMFPASSQGEI